jgi:xylulokinase
MRAAVFSELGDRLAIAYRPIETQMGEGIVEQDPEDWWRAGTEVLDEALQACAIRDDVRMITVTASAGCLVPVDAAIRPVRNAIMISDVRARKQADLIARLAVFVEIAQPGRRVTPDLMLPKILWLRDHEPAAYEAARWFATPNDFLIGCLTGEMVTDVHNASKYFHGLDGDDAYPGGLMSALHLDASRLPAVVDAPGCKLQLLPAIRDRFGLNAACEVVVSTYDAICAVYGAGVAAPGEACDVSGTVTSFRAVTDLKLRDPSGRLFVAPHVRKGLYLAGGSNNLGGGVIEWVKQLWYADQPDAYDAMERDAADAPPGAAGITFLPYLLGERAPIWDASARAVFFGLGRNHGRADMLRAVFEGVGFSILDIADRLGELGVDVHHVVASGGLARIASIQQIKADMLGVPVSLTEELESTALGAALVAGVNAGTFASMEEATRIAVRISRSFEPVAPRTEMYRDFFAVYRSLYASLKPLFAEREELIARHAEVLRTQPARTENL